MSRMPIVISHYTVNTPYQKEVENLEKSLHAFSLDHWIIGVASLGSWRLNSNYCAQQVRDALVRFPQRDILRVDCDAVFRRRPSLFDQEDFQADVAAHVHDFRWHLRELLGGTLFFRNNDKVRRLVDRWTYLSCVESKNLRNGDLLQELIDKNEFGIVFESLPATYCKIFDLMRDVKNPVIEHFQASRRFKQIINVQGLHYRRNR